MPNIHPHLNPIIIDEHGAHRHARAQTHRTGRPHGVVRDGDGYAVIALDAVYPARCVCGSPADGGALCCECGLALSTRRASAGEQDR